MQCLSNDMVGEWEGVGETPVFEFSPIHHLEWIKCKQLYTIQQKVQMWSWTLQHTPLKFQ